MKTIKTECTATVTETKDFAKVYKAVVFLDANYPASTLIHYCNNNAFNYLGDIEWSMDANGIITGYKPNGFAVPNKPQAMYNVSVRPIVSSDAFEGLTAFGRVENDSNVIVKAWQGDGALALSVYMDIEITMPIL